MDTGLTVDRHHFGKDAPRAQDGDGGRNSDPHGVQKSSVTKMDNTTGRLCAWPYLLAYSCFEVFLHIYSSSLLLFVILF